MGAPKCKRLMRYPLHGSELVAARIAVDIVIQFRYKFRVMGFEID
jgi:hypothetical protein